MSHLSAMAPSLTIENFSELLAHPDTGVQLLAARLLVSSDLAQSPLSQALLVQIHNSPVAAIRRGHRAVRQTKSGISLAAVTAAN